MDLGFELGTYKSFTLLQILACLLLILSILFAQDNFAFWKFSLFTACTYTLFQLYAVSWLIDFNFKLGIFAIILNSCWFTSTILLSFVLRKKLGVFWGYIYFILLWLANEFSHLYGVLHWPWLNVGNFFAYTPDLIQWYEYTGIAGGSFWLLSISCSFHYFFYKKALRFFWVVIFILFTPLVLSRAINLTNIESSKKLKVTIANPDLSNIFFDKNSGLDIIEKALVQIAKNDSSIFLKNSYLEHFIVFPEGTIKEPISEVAITKMIQKSDVLKSLDKHVFILWGGMLLEKTGIDIFYFNSVWTLNNKLLKNYRKEKLVPFIENKIYAQTIMNNWVAMNFENGLLTSFFQKQKNFISKNAEFSVGICYESAFGEFIASKSNSAASVIFILSNDMWIKSISGKLQHSQFSKLRAIENRKFIVNATKSGFSGFVDPIGNTIVVMQSSNQYFTQIISYMNKVTFYSRHGDWLYKICFMFLLFLLSLKLAIFFLITIIFRRHTFSDF